ncbi:serine/threonine protein kinase [Faecalicoccus pleomorphus]|uniref:serine/threonine protein kinase n=1 Tax=Faecalicoccus pleomorphus TaxID=1323 RepID=UPI00232D107B|nr:protein kinase [Faecalicoccus pleomorphus]MDB7985619.1 protein kinase [Faecalicoccus pleomorphus]
MCPQAQAVNIVCQLCDILMRLHQLKPPIIHRDIKPENIFYQDGKIILFDFDIARFYDPSKTRDTTLLGSVGYAAPEQFGFAQTGVQSDVYSCGRLLQVLLTGRLDQSVKGHFERIIRKALSMDPKDRFQSAAQLKAELQEMRWIFPGVNNRSRKGKVGSWIGWILSVCIVLSIDTQKNTSFEHDNLYLIACFLVLALLELVICNRHKVPKYDLSLVRWGILSLTYFLLLVGGIGILTLFDRMLSA